MQIRTLPSIGLAFLLALGWGCSDNGTGSDPGVGQVDGGVGGVGGATGGTGGTAGQGGEGGQGGVGGQGGAAGEPDAGEPEDVYVPEEGEFLWPCNNNSDCYSGWCVTTPQGQVCTQTCDESCPEGWNCRPLVKGDPVYICLPRWLHICDPCTETADCSQSSADTGHFCIDWGEKGQFCGGECESDGVCPKGYTCSDVPVSGQIKKQCVPESGDCECSPLAVQLELTTTCTISNEHGACSGTRKCSADGLSACDAKTPVAEICNGLDDNCNGATDDFPPDYVCQKTNEYGTCLGTGTCIGGVEICDAPNAQPEVCNGLDDNCDGSTDEGSFDTDNDTIKDCIDEDDDNDGVPDVSDNCPLNANPDQTNTDGDGDGDACDDDDDADGVADENDCEPLNGNVFPGSIEKCDGIDNDCNGIPDDNVCNDGNPCTQDACTADGNCVYEPIQGIDCDDGSICTQKDSCIDGVCQGLNPLICDDGNPCTDDICDQAAGCYSVFNTAPCDDGSLCTEGDACLNGVCQSGSVKNCNDGNPCTFNQCDPLIGCTSQNADGSGCTASSSKCPQGTCIAGTCQSKAGVQCTAKYEVDLCQDVEVTGQCTASGECNVDSAPPGLTCPNCPGLCIQCFIQLCIPF